MDGPTEEGTGSTGPPDRQTLRLLERHLASDPLVIQSGFDPGVHEPRLLQVTLDLDRYPEPVASARLEIRWFTTDDFSFHYLEERNGHGQWECRWDRHPNPHSTRVHFHEPPDATTVVDLSLPSVHPLEVYSTVLGAIERRIETLWEA